MKVFSYRNVIVSIMILFATIIYAMSCADAYLSPYDIDYVKDLYDHSQWSITKNVRHISDDKVYQVAADRFLITGDIFSVNAQTTPFGIYIYALSIIIFGNPFILLPLHYILASLLFVFIIANLQKSKKVLFALALFLLEPMIGLQMGITRLELPLLILLLLHILTLFYVPRFNHRYLAMGTSLLAGVLLGLFAATNLGALALILYISSVWFLLVNRKTKHSFTLLLGSTIGYILASLPYFIIGNSLSSWLSVEALRISYYFEHTTPYLPFAIFISLATPFQFTGTSLQSPHIIQEWNLLWPLTLASLFVYAAQRGKIILQGTIDRTQELLRIRPKELKWYETENQEKYNIGKRISYIYLLLLLFAIHFAFMPFSPYYLTLITPLSIIVLVFGIDYSPLTQKIKATILKSFLAIFLLVQIVIIVFILRPSPSDYISSLKKHLENSTYQDLYSSLANINELNESRLTFWRRLTSAQSSMKVTSKKVSIQSAITYPWQDNTTLPYQVAYTTPIGQIQHSQEIKLKRINNTWKLVWDDNILLPDYKKGDSVSLSYYPVQGGVISDQEGRVISEVTQFPSIYILPQGIKHTEKVKEKIMQIIAISSDELESRIYANQPYDTFAYIGKPVDDYAVSALEELAKMSGILIAQEPSRVFIGLTKEQKDFIKNYINNNPELEPKLGGKIELTNKVSGKNITIYEFSGIPGENASLEI